MDLLNNLSPPPPPHKNSKLALSKLFLLHRNLYQLSWFLVDQTVVFKTIVSCIESMMVILTVFLFREEKENLKIMKKFFIYLNRVSHKTGFQLELCFNYLINFYEIWNVHLAACDQCFLKKDNAKKSYRNISRRSVSNCIELFMLLTCKSDAV